jgi:hypothetical protein
MDLEINPNLVKRVRAEIETRHLQDADELLTRRSMPSMKNRPRNQRVRAPGRI